tara:strand:+ start:97735 stop:98268 length:534 start_codon:yes stop_codon:yes gene_type:complete
MSISMHAITVPVFQTMLTNLDFVLGRGAEFVAETGLDEGELMERNLAPDMLKLAEQIRQACIHATGAMARLAGVDAPDVSMEPDTDIAGARARVAAALDFVGSFSAAQLDGDPDREVIVKTRLGELKFGALEHVLHIAYPQVFFHVTTAYDLLRAEGVQIGKIDFLGAPMKSRVANK